MKHSYSLDCSCPRCTRERERRRSFRDRTTAEIMQDWLGSSNRRRARIARRYWDAYESGRPISDMDR